MKFDIDQHRRSQIWLFPRTGQFEIFSVLNSLVWCNTSATDDYLQTGTAKLLSLLVQCCVAIVRVIKSHFWLHLYLTSGDCNTPSQAIWNVGKLVVYWSCCRRMNLLKGVDGGATARLLVSCVHFIYSDKHRDYCKLINAINPSCSQSRMSVASHLLFRVPYLK